MAQRRSVSKQEVGIDTWSGEDLAEVSRRRAGSQCTRSREQSAAEALKSDTDVETDDRDKTSDHNQSISRDQAPSTTPPANSGASRAMLYRFGAGLLCLAAVVSLLQSAGFVRQDAAVPLQGVSGGAIPQEASLRRRSNAELERRASATNWCFKWAQMSAIVNSTLYLYGGQVATQTEQTQTLENTWTNDFISIDLSKTWQTGGPPLKALTAASNVPPVALGYLWNSVESLWLYGGEYSWKPPVTPAPFATWEYNIAKGEWIEHSNPKTSAGLSAPDSGVAVQRSAEGAGVNIPTLGRGFYMGGHLDAYTTPGWSVVVPRQYLKSMIEFTFPGFSNKDVNSLGKTNTAGSDGVYRNITKGGIENAGFTARADGILTYVPGFGAQGVLISLAGGTNMSFTQMNTINVYDIATGEWYNQATSGPTPDTRVNPCSVVAASPDGSSYNIYMFGGQDLLPYGSQKQKDDMWILSVPSFIWIKVDQGGQSVPAGRSGATCDIWDGQMVMVGGYLGNPKNGLTCEYPAVYVFDLSNLIWQTHFTSLSTDTSNYMDQQPAQLYSDKSMGGLPGSYGYTVPQAVISQIGGGKYGGATLTKPTISATGGPFKTGSPIVYTTQTSKASYTDSGSGSNAGKIAAIVVGVVCGIAFIVILYLLFCLYVYRKQLALYKRHVEMAQAQARGEKPTDIPGLWASDSETAYASERSKFAGNYYDGTNSHVGSSAKFSGVGTQGDTASSAAAGGVVGGSGFASARRSSEISDTEDLLADHEPTFVGVMLNPRRSLRVINRD